MAAVRGVVRNRVVGDRRTGIIPGLSIGRRKRLVVLGVVLRSEVPVVIVEAVGVVETVLQRHAVHMPFTRMIRAIPQGPQHIGQEPGPGGPRSPGAAWNAGERDLLADRDAVLRLHHYRHVIPLVYLNVHICPNSSI